MAKRIGDFVDYLKQITEVMTDNKSFLRQQEAYIEQLMQEYGFTNVEKSEILARMTETSTNFINQYATSGAMELIKEEKSTELIQSQKDKIAAEIRLIEAQVKLTECQVETCIEKRKLIPIEIEKIEAEVDDIKARQILTKAQIELIKRQTQNYDDNLLVKSAEFQGGLASYSVNAAAKNSQDAINAFLTTIAEVKGRS